MFYNLENDDSHLVFSELGALNFRINVILVIIVYETVPLKFTEKMTFIMLTKNLMLLY